MNWAAPREPRGGGLTVGSPDGLLLEFLPSLLPVFQPEVMARRPGLGPLLPLPAVQPSG